jgi:NAD(P)-dependent dehydrogenase (short-subunit alcohol dehydrogenase family)
LSITYGDQGIRVSCVCPMGVNTNMLNSLDPGGGDAIAGDVVRAAGGVLEPEEVADIVADGIAAERFLILPHPEVLTFFQRKASDYDRWLAGMRRLQARVRG